MNHFKSNLKYLRKKKALSQEWLAHNLGIKKPRLAAWEEGRSEPSIDMIIKICDYFEIKPTALLCTIIIQNEC